MRITDRCLAIVLLAAVALTAHGEPFGWGSNEQSQLGDGTATDRSKPVTVVTSGVLAGKNVTAIAAGFYHTVARTSDGRLFAWGNNGFGQLGDGSTGTVFVSGTPVAVSTNGVLAGKTVTAITAGWFHTVARTSDGKLFAWGYNSKGQLGNGKTATEVPYGEDMPIAVDMTRALAGKTVIAIAAGADHTVALTSDGKLFAWGGNFAGQLGDGTTTDRTRPVAVVMSGALAGKTVTALAAGDYHTVVLTSDGKLFAWGETVQGQLGVGFILNGNEPVAVNMSGALAGKSVTAISAGSFHTVAQTSDGKVFAWGYNHNGQLGDGTTTSRFTPVSVDMNGVLSGKSISAIAAGNSHTVAMTSDGQLFAWGGNDVGELGDGTNVDRHTPVAVSMNGALSGKLATAIAAGDHHTLVLATPADTKTRVPLLTAPATPTLTNSPMSVSFTLPEAALAGSVRLRFGDESGLRTLTLASTQESSGRHSFQFDPAAPMASPEIVSGMAIPDGTYTVALIYQDVRGNPAASAVSRDVTINTKLPLPTVVATKATNVNGQTEGMLYAGFATPQTGAFSGVIMEGKTRLRAVFAAEGTLLAKVGGSLDELPGAIIVAIGQPSGDVVLAKLKPGAGGITAANNVVLLRGLSSGMLQVAARTGTENIGLPGGVTIKTFGTMDGNGSAAFFLSTLQGSIVTPQNSLALCVARDDGSVRVILSKGDQVNGRIVSIIGTLVGSAGTLAEGRWRLNDTTIGVRLTFSDKSQGVFAIPADAANSEDWTQIAQTGPSSDIANLNGTTIASFGLPAFGPEGMAVLAYLAKATDTVTTANDVALITYNGATAPTVLARKGEPIAADADGDPLTGVTIKRLADPIMGGGGGVAFMLRATRKGIGTGVAYSADGTAWKLLANTGSAAPGGGKWARFSTLVLPNGMQSGPLFLGRLKASTSDNTTAENNFGLWGVDTAGTLQLLLRTGQTVLVGTTNKTLKTFAALTPAPGSIGAASGYDDGRISALATFTDRTQAVLQFSAP